MSTRRLLTASVARSRRAFASAATTPASLSARPTDFDVVVIGGGISGLCLAADLGSRPATSHLKTCLIEASDLSKIETWSPSRVEWGNRISSVTNENREWMSSIGAWDHVDSSRLGPIEEMQVWDSLTPSRITFTSPPPTAMSTLVENMNLQRACLRLIRESSKNVTLLGGSRVEGISREESTNGVGEWPVVRLTDGSGLRARLVVGADGLRSPVRAFSGIESQGHSYDTHTIVSVMTHNPYPPPPTPTTLTAFQRFLPSGPLAFLPLTQTRASLAWHINPPELSAAVKALPEETLLLAINACFRLPEHAVKHILSEILSAHRADPTNPYSYSSLHSTISLVEASSSIQPHSHLSLVHPPSHLGIPPKDHYLVPPLCTTLQPGATASFPLAYSHAASYVAPRVALVGDAAHTVHPHAGMGLNMGLADVRSLANHLERAVRVGGDLGSLVSLQPYERERWIENQKVLSATDALQKMFKTDNALLRWARSTGIDVLEELDGVKTLIMNGSGASASSRSSAASLLPALGNVVATGLSAAQGSKMLAEGVAGMVGRGIRGFAEGVLNRRL